MVHDLTPEPAAAGPGDTCQPFVLGGGAIRGRLARCSVAAHDILARHGDPVPVGELLGQALVASVALASGLKYDGIFTLQVQGDGPVHTLVVDITSRGQVRGCVKFDNGRLTKALAKAKAQGRPGNLTPRLLGNGHLSFTVDQGPDTDRYQGIVALDGATLPEAVHHYFQQSEQVASALRIAVLPPDPTVPRWRAAGLVLQRLPRTALTEAVSDDEWDDAWRTAVILMGSVSDAELVSDALPADRLLHRLFATVGVSEAPARRYAAGCRCSRARSERILASFPMDEIKALADDGVVRMTCEFCRTDYVYSLQDIDRLHATTR
ncbi:MAG: Hsp33 family molecular chaperone HslO [Rhodospirillaceae bacterium]|nr:Hsp33 family molecular chaperone HslO [Rhodospirillaceae bacterium]